METSDLSFLKERMKFKAVDINELQLPRDQDIHEIPRVDFIYPVKNVVEDSRSILTDDLPDVMKGRTLATQKKKIISQQPPITISRWFPHTTHDVDSPPATCTKIISIDRL